MHSEEGTLELREEENEMEMSCMGRVSGAEEEGIEEGETRC